jgi:transcriptional regulator of arginine metabolism
MSKRARQNLIQTILREGQIASQEELRLELAARGVVVVQATLSRDLRELGVVKGAGGYLLPDAAANGHPRATSANGAGGGRSTPLARAVREYLVSATSAGNLVVVRTGPGRAQPVALELDLAPPPEALGTVAGDDTIFIATATPGASARLAASLSEMAGLSPLRSA